MIYNHFIGDTYPSKNSRAGTRPPNTTKRPNLPERFERKAFSIPSRKKNNMECGLAKNLLIITKRKTSSNYVSSISGIEIHNTYSNNTIEKTPIKQTLTTNEKDKTIDKALEQLIIAKKLIDNYIKTNTNQTAEQIQDDSCFFTQEEAANFLRVKVRTLRNYHKKYGLVAHGIKKKFYLKADIYAIGAKLNEESKN